MPESVLKSRWNDRETPEELEIQWQQIIDKMIAQDCPHDNASEFLLEKSHIIESLEYDGRGRHGQHSTQKISGSSSPS